MDRSRTVTRLRRLADPEEDPCIDGLTPGERMALVWPLTLQAWGFKEGRPMSHDFPEMLSALSAASVEYLVVGAYALAAHGLPRATGDLDIRVRATPNNADRVFRALRAF